MYVPMRTAFIPNMYVNHAADAMATSKIADASAHPIFSVTARSIRARPSPPRQSRSQWPYAAPATQGFLAGAIGIPRRPRPKLTVLGRRVGQARGEHQARVVSPLSVVAAITA